MRYILALLPDQPERYVEEAHKRFAAFSEGYLLSETSLPHISLVHFHLNQDLADPNDLTEHALLDQLLLDQQVLVQLWKEIKEKEVPRVTFIGIGFTKKAHNLWNVSLTVDRDPALIALHSASVTLLKTVGIAAITPIQERYRPHLTLARITKLCLTDFNDELLGAANCSLALGIGDENGQFLKKLS